MTTLGKSGPVILELDLTQEVLESAPTDPLRALQARRKTVLRTLTQRLHRAAEDPRVWGLVARLGTTPTGLGRMQEVRAAVTAFQRAGKPTVAWAESFGEFGPGTVPYYVATAFDEIWLQPSGEIGLTGVAIQAVFMRDALDKLGVMPQFSARHEYKNAANTLTEREFTPAHREATEGLVGSISEHLLGEIARARGLVPVRLKKLVDQAPLSATEALQAGLIDRIGYRDEVYAAVRARVGADARLRYLARYQPPPAKRLRRAFRRSVADRRKIGFVHAVGGIRLGRSGPGPFGQTAGSDTLTAALRACARDPLVSAVVLRVDSPGGSYVASDTVHRAVTQLRATGRPVIVSMGDVAASGGYFISMGADTIVADPGTLTGSIGVLAGKAVLGPFLDRLGIDNEAVGTGERATMNSPFRPFTDAEQQAIDRFLDRVYQDFVTKAAEARKMPYERIHDLARGRVWTGADAHERGLVDQLGGLADAFEEARRLARLKDDAPVVAIPHITPLQRLRPPESSDDPNAAAATIWLESWGSLASLASRIGMPPQGPLALPVHLRVW